MNTPKILVYDIETAPNLGYIWGKYEQNVIEFKQEWYMLSFAYKWLGQKQTKVIALPDFKQDYKKDPEDDRNVVEALWQLFDEADMVIAHNGDKFDQRRSNARFLHYGLTPPSPYKSIDTLKVSRKYFGLMSHKLDDLGSELGVGNKLEHMGWKLWRDCLAGKKSAWAIMKKYNKQDVVLLEKVYYKLLPWMEQHPTMGIYTGDPDSCPKCGATDLIRNGFKPTKTTVYQQWKCTNCGGHARGRTAEKGLKPNFVS